MLISFTDPVILKTTPDAKMVNSWHATKISGILHVNFTFMCAQCCFFFVFLFCSSVCLRCLIVDSLNFSRQNTEAGVHKM